MDGTEDDETNRASQAEPDEIVQRWLAGDMVGFFALFERLHRTRLWRYLGKMYRVSEEDAEDAIGDALSDLLRLHAQHPERIANPVGYITECAKYASLRHKKHWGTHAVSDGDAGQITGEFENDDLDTRDVVEHGDNGAEPIREIDEGSTNPILLELGDPEVILDTATDERVVELVEESFGDAEIEAHWAREVVEVAITRLTLTEAKVVGLFLARSGLFNPSTNSYDIKSSAALEELGMTSAAFRQAKSRAFLKLKALIPKIIDERGIRPPVRFEAELFPDRWSTPEEEE